MVSFAMARLAGCRACRAGLPCSLALGSLGCRVRGWPAKRCPIGCSAAVPESKVMGGRIRSEDGVKKGLRRLEH